MADEEPLTPEIDVNRPSVARIYDYWLGGKDNFAADREMAGRMAGLNPLLPQQVRTNRAFLCAAAARAAGAGVGQFLDLGAGLPAHPAVHEAARAVLPKARVCYVDNDPAAVIHGRALLDGVEGLAAIEGDLTDPGAVLAHPMARALLDFTQPVGIILGAVLHFVPAPQAARLCARYMSAAAPGSWLIVSTGHYHDRELAARLQRTATHARFFNHDEAAMASWLAGLRIVSPGICAATRWADGAGGVPASQPAYALVAAAVKAA